MTGSPDRIFNAEARAIDAMVWIDGVEVPFMSLAISIQVDTPSSVQIAIEPDELIDVWRPKSWVHIWIRDPFAGDARVPHDGSSPAESDQRDLNYDLDTYNLFWEGEVVAIRDSESSEARQTTIEAQDLWNIPMHADINLVEIGSGLKTAFINGSTFFGDIAGGESKSLVMLGLLKYLFGDGDKAYSQEPTDDSKLRNGVTVMGKQLLKYLSQFNASYGFQAWRTDFLEKFTGVSDAAMQNFLRLSLVQDMVNSLQSNQPTSNVLAYMQELITKFYHHFVTIPLPGPAQEGQNTRRQVWNEFAIVPNLYYALPPMCNWLFPEHYTGRDVGRSFMTEPTRLGMTSIMSSTAGFRTVHLAPETLVQFLEDQSSAPISSAGDDPTSLTRLSGGRDADTNNIKVVQENQIEFAERGFYIDKTAQNPVNLLKYLTPAELEKGILYVESGNAYQELLGLGRLNKNAEDAADSRNSIQERLDKNDPYLGYMRLLAQFELNFKQVSRQASVQGIFNPWPVVGLPMLICREGRSYKGLLTAIQHQISYGGQASTSYQLGFTQLFRPKSLRERSGFQQAQKSLTQANDIRRTQFQSTISSLLRRGLITQKAAKALDEDRTSLVDLQSTLNQVSDQLNEADPDTSSLEEEHRRLRGSASIFLALYGATWWDSYDEYTGFCLGMLDSQPKIQSNYFTLFKSGFTDGSAAPESLRSVLVDQYGEEITSPWPEKANIEADDVSLFWSKVARPFREAFETIRELVQAISQGQSANPILATDPATERKSNQTQNAINQRIEDLQTTKSEIQQLADEEGLKIEAQVNALEAIITEVGGGNVGEVADSTVLAAYQARLRHSSDLLLEEALNIETQSAAAAAAIDAEIAAEEAKLAALPAIAFWDWSGSLDQAIQTYLTQIPTTVSVSDAVSRVEVSIFNPVFIDGSSEISVSETTWLSYAQQAGQNTAIAVILSKLREFSAGYTEYFGVDPATLNSRTILSNIAATTKDATDFTFESRAERFNRDFGPSIEVINQGVSVFKQFLQENQLELPPLMPFSNTSLIDISAFDETIKNMVVPREDIGTFDYWKDGVAPAFSNQNSARTTQQLGSLRQTVIFRYDEFVRMARKIFPFNEEDSGTEYQAQSAQGTAASWANKVQARRGITMREFQNRYGLKVEARSASDPDTFGKGTYYIAVAEFVVLQDNDFNSFFSKLGRINPVSVTTPLRDPLFASINEIRNVARNGTSPDWDFLKASVRQGIIEEYTKRHAVARAFRGKR